jgi:hypothetical protein
VVCRCKKICRRTAAHTNKARCIPLHDYQFAGTLNGHTHTGHARSFGQYSAALKAVDQIVQPFRDEIANPGKLIESLLPSPRPDAPSDSRLCARTHTITETTVTREVSILAANIICGGAVYQNRAHPIVLSERGCTRFACTSKALPTHGGVFALSQSARLIVYVIFALRARGEFVLFHHHDIVN